MASLPYQCISSVERSVKMRSPFRRTAGASGLNWDPRMQFLCPQQLMVRTKLGAIPVRVGPGLCRLVSLVIECRVKDSSHGGSVCAGEAGPLVRSGTVPPAGRGSGP